MKVIPLILALSALLAPPVLLRSASPSAAAPGRVFFDTDMHTDCDDAGALAVLHALADRGECANLARTPSANPVRLACFHYFGGQQKSRHAADLATVLYADQAAGFQLQAEGTNGWAERVHFLNPPGALHLPALD